MGVSVFAAAERYDWLDELLELGARAGFEVRPDVLLAALTSLHVGGPAAAVIMPKDPEALQAALTWARERGVPCVMFGSGTRLIAADRGFPGLVIDLGPGFSWVAERRQLDGAVVWEVGAACAAAKVVRRAAIRGLAVAPLAKVSGSVGGALAAGVDLGALLSRVQVLSEGELTWMTPDDFAAVRPLVNAVISAELRPTPARAEALLSALTSEERRQVGVGPVFADPEGDSAVRLMAAAGLMNAQLGRAVFVDTLPNRVLNLGGATAAEVLGLCERVRQIVAEKTGQKLALMLRPVGLFEGEVAT